MNMSKVIHRAAVLGAGVMGSGIAALLAAAGVQVTLLDVVPKQLDEKEIAKGLTEASPAFRNRLSQAGYDRIKNLRTGMLYEKSQLANITVGNMTDDMDSLAECDWIIEVVLERLDIKRSVMQQVAAHRKPGSIVSSNTSGVSINAICQGLDKEFRAHFLGTHFFNPPRYMRLFEIIPTDGTSPEVVQTMARFAEEELGKVVVYAKDTPNFVGNRVGVYAAMRPMQLMEAYGYNIPTVDFLTGPVIGRPKSASYKTADMVGLDIMLNVAGNVLENAADPAEQALYAPPAFAKDLVAAGALGDKVKCGFYQKKVVDGKKITLAYDPATKTYQPLTAEEFPSVKTALKSPNKYAAMAYGDSKESRFVWDVLKSALLYAARLIPEIADDYTMVDKALVAGFNWELGPFQIWDKLDVRKSVDRMKAEGDEIPAWVEQRLAEGKTTFYDEAGTKSRFLRVSASPVLEQNGSAALHDLGDGVLGLEFKSKGNAIDPDTLTMIHRGVELLGGNDWVGMVLGNEGKNFSAGASLNYIGQQAEAGNWDALRKQIRNLQKASMALKYAPRPVVAAPFGSTLGGGCELTMHSAAATPHAETYLGLVEAGVGLLPAGGGCKELLVRTVALCGDTSKMGMLNPVKRAWKLIATGAVCTGGFDAVAKGFLSRDTHVVMNRDLLIEAAKRRVLELAAWGFHPAATAQVPVLGEYGRASIIYELEGMEKGGFVSAYDAVIAKKIAYVMTGGGLPAGTIVTEQHLLDLECEAFLSLCGEEKTRQRIAHMLTTGKPLRN